jgi:hypothetical protein
MREKIFLSSSYTHQLISSYCFRRSSNNASKKLSTNEAIAYVPPIIAHNLTRNTLKASLVERI